MATLWYFTKARETGQLVEISKEEFYYLLEVLPPIYAKGCYGLSEIVDHTPEGEPILLWFNSHHKGKFTCFHGTRAQAEAEYSKLPQKAEAA